MSLSREGVLSPPDGTADGGASKLLAAQIQQLYSQSGVGAVGATLGGIVLTVALWDVVSHYRLVVFRFRFSYNSSVMLFKVRNTRSFLWNVLFRERILTYPKFPIHVRQIFLDLGPNIIVEAFSV